MDNPLLLYYRSPGQIEEYRSMPALQKIRKLEMEMEFLYYIRAEKAKRIRGRLKKKYIQGEQYGQ